MRKHLRLSFFMLLAGAYFASGPALAGFRVCNNATKTASTRLAIAMNPIPGTVAILEQAWVFVYGGWNTVAPGACLTIIDRKDPPDTIYYMYATDDAGGYWQIDQSAPRATSGGYSWPAVKDICEADPNQPITDHFDNSCHRVPYSAATAFDGTNYIVTLK